VANKVVVTVFAMMVAASGSAFAKGDVAAGKSKSAACASCHGVTGVSSIGAYPNLAGQGYTYLVNQLKAFRDGKRKDPLMAPMAKPLSDQDIDNLAAFFSAQTGAQDSKPAK
jgi:cytochrome c553